MKRSPKRKQQDHHGRLAAQLAQTRMMLSALVMRLGGRVEIPVAEMNAVAGEDFDMFADPSGVVIERKRRVMLLKDLN